MSKKGYTLIEVVLAVVVVAISVAATMLIMSKMMSYTANRGQAVDIANAVTISQEVVDYIRNQKFPPTTSVTTPIVNLQNFTDSITLSNITYTYTADIAAANGSGTSPIDPSVEYNNNTNTDSMAGNRNLLKITILVYKNNRLILKTVTYKTRNGYY